jgi:ABC-2 type transport system permease protein
MSATSATLEAPARATVTQGRVTQGRVTQLRVIRSEWTKLWSLRSTRWTLLVAILGMAGLGPLIATVQMNRWDHMGPGDRLHFNPINTGLGDHHFAQLAIGVLGVLVLTGEYSTGQIRSTFMAVPKRLPVLWAKAGTFATVTFVLMLISGLVAFLASQSILTQHHVQTTLGHAPALRSWIGAALYLAVLGVLALSLGAIVRSPPAGSRCCRSAVRGPWPGGDPPDQHPERDQPLPALGRRHGDPVGHPRRLHVLALGRLRAVLRLHRARARHRRGSHEAPRRVTSPK